MIPSRPLPASRYRPPPLSRLRARLTGPTDGGDLLEWTSALAAGLRSGMAIPEALRVTARSRPDTPPRARRVVAELAHGRAVRHTLHEWRRDAGSAGERLLVTALGVAIERGGQPVMAVDVVVDRLRDDRYIDLRRRVLTAQAQATTVVLVVLPVVFAVFASAIRGELLLAGRIGAVLFVIGLAFDGLGFWWMRRLRRRWL